MTDIDKLVARILALIHDPSLRTGAGSQFPVLEIYTPVDPQIIESAEASLGFQLPELLRRCYLRVGNGGFGPGHGMVGLQEGYPDDLSCVCLPELYHYYRQEDTDNPWPQGLLPLFVMGCGLVDSIDCLTPGFPVVRMDDGRKHTGIPLYDWMNRWVTDMERKQASTRRSS
jgi:hypothetical protein